MRLRLTSVLALVGLALSAPPTEGSAQTLREYRRAARKLLAEGDSVGALAVYREAFADSDDVLDAATRIETAELADALRYHTVAKRYYGIVAGSDQAGDYPALPFRLAEAQRRTGAYDAARGNYERALAQADRGEVGEEAIRAGIAATDWALGRASRMDSVEAQRLGPLVNTVNSEFAPAVRAGELYFSRLELRDYADRGRGTRSRVLRVPRDSTGAQVAGEAAPGGIDTAVAASPSPGRYVAHAAFTPAGDRAYFTVCEAVDLVDYRCELYVVGFGESGPVGEPERLPGAINPPGFTQTNPAVGRDSAAGRDVLYFASDRPGGRGGMDLWAAPLDDGGGVGAPQNLTALNTAADDVTPFFHDASQALFFATKGRETLGGFDVYRAERRDTGWAAPVGLKAPINSTFDDTYYALADAPARGYVSSNRPGAACPTEEIRECCGFDLYAVDLAVALEALAFDALDSTALDSTTVVLADLATGLEVARLTGATNLAAFDVEPGRDYRLVASRPGYGNDTAEVSTRDLYEPTLLTRELYLPPALSLEVLTFDAITREPLGGTRVTLTGPAATVTRDDPAGNRFAFDVVFGRTYAAVGERAGYSPAGSTIATAEFRGPGRVLRDSLYLTPFTPLPLVLYFDNDRPDPRSTDPATTATYLETVPEYLAREDRFRRRAASGAEAVTRFFDEVEGNAELLREFSAKLVAYLRDGNEIDMVVEGYASPIAPSDYNALLTSRRTRSLINHILQWEGGALLPFLASGQLRIRQEPYGEGRAPDNISDSPADRAASEYGVPASRERRVRIIDIRGRGDLPVPAVPSENESR